MQPVGAQIGQTAFRAGPERDQAAEVLARAFQDAPVTRAVVAGSASRRLRSNRHGMRLMLQVAATSARTWSARARGGTSGVLIGVPPRAFPPAPPPVWSQLRCLAGQGWSAVRRWGLVERSLREVHPEDPHWYLALVGVVPEQQRSGIGSALVGAFVAEVDANRQPAYLESDRPENVPFYERFGFEVVREHRVLGVPVWCMWRAPK